MVLYFLLSKIRLNKYLFNFINNEIIKLLIILKIISPIRLRFNALAERPNSEFGWIEPNSKITSKY